MRQKRRVLMGFMLSFAVLANGTTLVNAAKLYDENKEVINIDGVKKTEKDLNDAISFNSSYTPSLELADFKVMSKKYEKDSRLKSVIDKKYKELLDASKDTDKNLKNAYQLFGAKDKDDFIKKSNILLDSYRELAAMDAAYDNLFTKEQKDYMYKYKFSATNKIYHLVVSPNISYIDSTDEKKLDAAKAEALKKAEAAIAELNKGTAFKDVVAKYSSDQLNADGYLGEFDVNSATEAKLDASIKLAAFQLEDKKYTTTPIETKYGYEIVYVEEVKAKKSYDDVKNEIKSKLYDLYTTNNTNTKDYALTIYRNDHDIVFEDNNYSKAYANTVIQAKKSYVQFDPNQQQNPYGY